MRSAVMGMGVAMLASALWGATLNSTASAHAASTFYPYTYAFNTSEKWVFDNNVPTGDFRTAISFGIGQWDNGAGGNAPNFVQDGETTTTNDFDPCTGLRSKVFVYENLALRLGYPSESVLGYTPTCLEGSSAGALIGQFSMTLERTAELGGANGWFGGDGAVPSNRWDLRSIVTHEAGHATGFYGHFATDAACPATPSASVTQTMCHGDADIVGTQILRSLEEHDLHTLANAY